MGFTTPSYSLSDLFARINRGDIQLPDFQRAYSWDEDRIRSLVVTVLRGYPVGALMALDTRDEHMRFRPRPLEGAPDRGVNPGMLLLDGQQRLTTMYQCLAGEGWVKTRDFRSKKIERTFYIDIRTAVSEEIVPDEAIFAVNRSGEIRSHFGPAIDGPLLTRDDAIANYCLPVASLLQEEGTAMLFAMVANADAETQRDLAAFNNRVLRPLAGYDVPIMRVFRDTHRAGLGSIFVQANSAGLQMDVFDLLTAVFASEDPDFHLSESWAEYESQLREHPALDGIGRTQFLSAVSLLVTAEKGNPGGQREDILSLSLADYQQAAPVVCKALGTVAEFLAERCVFALEQVPYTAQIIPLAVILARLEQSPGALDSQKAWDRLHQWFWCGVFGELYGSSAVKLRAARDVVEVTDWVKGETKKVPKTVEDANFRESRLLSVDETSGVWHGLYALLMAQGAKDWRTARKFNEESYEEFKPGFHRIFPVAWCQRKGLGAEVANSVLNHTPLGKRTEVVLDGYSPERYLGRVQSKSLMEDSEFDAVLATHNLDVEALHEARAADFFADRRSRLVKVIQHAIGKQVLRDVDEKNFSGGEEGPEAFAR